MSNKKANKGRHIHVAPTEITKETPGVTIELLCEEEYESPEGHFASGDDEEDREMVRGIIERANNGDAWAWFCAHVRVTFGEFTADEYLGACSYESEADFINSEMTCTAPDGTVTRGGYYSDMVATCIDNINAQIAKAAHLAACTHCQAVKVGALPHPIA